MFQLKVPFFIASLLATILLLINYSAVAEVGLRVSNEKEVTTSAAESLGSPVEGLGLSVGDSVPVFTIHDVEGNAVSRDDLLKSAPVMIIFYRGGWCPFCNFQTRHLARDYQQFADRGVTPVLISVDRLEGAQQLQQEYDIQFPVLSDPELAALTAFNVKLQVGKQRYDAMKSKGLDLEEWSKGDHHVIAVSSAFIVDKQGTVQWAHISEDFKTRPSNGQLLTVIDQLTGDHKL